MSTTPVKSQPMHGVTPRERSPKPIAAGVEIGHVHLKTADIDRVHNFYVGILGFDVIFRMRDALFLSAGGYHHHLGFNTWESMRALGMASFMRMVPEFGVIEIGHIWFAPELQRTRQATEAIYLMAKHAFDDLGNRRLEWKCDSLNEPSKRAAERFGFTFEGVFRQHMVVKGRNRDTTWFSMTDAEWPLRRAAFEAWLAPDNFDEEGRQRRSLAAFRASPRS